MLGFDSISNEKSENLQSSSEEMYKVSVKQDSLPDTVDWVKAGWVTPVLMQVGRSFFSMKS